MPHFSVKVSKISDILLILGKDWKNVGTVILIICENTSNKKETKDVFYI